MEQVPRHLDGGARRAGILPPANESGSAFDPAAHPVSHHERRIAYSESAEETQTPPWLAWTGIDSMQTVPAVERGKSALLVTGDSSRNKELCVPGGGFAIIKIVLPKAWDSLMAERGYKPIAEFTLMSDLKPDTPTPRTRRRPTHAGARGDRPYGQRLYKRR